MSDGEVVDLLRPIIGPYLDWLEKRYGPSDSVTHLVPVKKTGHKLVRLRHELDGSALSHIWPNNAANDKCFIYIGVLRFIQSKFL